jgi:uncharacterized membrane protein
MAFYAEIIEKFDQPAETIFALLTDINRQPEWIEEIQSITRLPELPLRVGSTYEQSAKYYGRTVAIQMEIVGYEPNRLLKQESSGSMPTVTSWWLESAAGGTNVHYEFEGRPGGMYDMIAPGLEGQIKRGLHQQVLNLKALLDGQPKG